MALHQPPVGWRRCRWPDGPFSGQSNHKLANRESTTILCFPDFFQTKKTPTRSRASVRNSTRFEACKRLMNSAYTLRWRLKMGSTYRAFKLLSLSWHLTTPCDKSFWRKVPTTLSALCPKMTSKGEGTSPAQGKEYKSFLVPRKASRFSWVA